MELYDETDPFDLFARWFERAKTHEMIKEPTAMCLATANEDSPSARIVLLKDYDRSGFVFYTNMESRKSRECKTFGSAALCFYWMPLDLQVRIVGEVSAIDDAQADAYFASRGREKQLGAWASIQSQPMRSRDALDERVAEMRERFPEGQPVPRPPHWSGWKVRPKEMEFWEQKEYRLHERIVFHEKQGNWEQSILYP